MTETGVADTRADARKRKVARAAARLFSRKTYLDTTMDEIAEAARVSKGGMYYYFRKKSDVLFFILDRVMDDLLDGLPAELAGLPAGAPRLRHIMTRHLTYYGDNLAEVRTLLNDRQCLDRGQFRVIEAKQQVYFDLVRRTVAECLGRDPSPDLNPVAFAFFGICNWIPGWFKPSGAITIEELIETTYKLYMHGLDSFEEERG